MLFLKRFLADTWLQIPSINTVFSSLQELVPASWFLEHRDAASDELQAGGR